MSNMLFDPLIRAGILDPNGWFVKGGICMFPLLLCSIAAVAVIIERLWATREFIVLPDGLMKSVMDLAREGNFSKATDLCVSSGSSMARIAMVALKSSGKRRETIKEAVEEAGRKEAIILEKNLRILDTIVGIAPLLGLLGTVMGMVTVFSEISFSGVGDPKILSAGISEALITTVTGLIIAIPSLVAHRYMAGKVDSLVYSMEHLSLELLDIVKLD